MASIYIWGMTPTRNDSTPKIVVFQIESIGKMNEDSVEQSDVYVTKDFNFNLS